MYLTKALSKYIFELQYENLPAPVVDATRKCVFDSMANIICGRYTQTGKQILDYVSAFAHKSDESKNVSVLDAPAAALEDSVLAHTVMARCADLDDGHRYAMGHPGCVLVPVALAVAEAYGKTGKDVICALVAGYDVYARIGSGINPSSYRDRGFDATGLCGAIAAAVVTAKLMDCTEAQICDAMGLSSLFCGGLIEYQNDGTMGKVLCGSWAALTGIRAVQLATMGFTGPLAALEGKKGFAQAFSNASNLEHVLDDLGSNYRITEVYFKLYACMRGLHSAIDAILWLRENKSLIPSNIKSVTVWTTEFVQRLSNPTPTTHIGAQCSLEFTMATAIKFGHLSDEELLVESLQDDEVLELARKIVIRLDDAMVQFVKENPSHWSAVRISVEKIDGTICEKMISLPSGEPERPLDWEIMQGKFYRMTEKTPISAYAAKAAKEIRRLDQIADLCTLWKNQ